MKGTLADYEIASVAETAIVDIFPFEADKTNASTLETKE